MEEKPENKGKYFRRMLDNIGSLVRVNSFKQQKLPAWRPILRINSVVGTFVMASIALVIIGIGFLYVSGSKQSFSIDYTHCMPLYGTRSCAQILTDWQLRTNGSITPPECTCWYKFELEEDFRSNVYVYYGLSNYYQNHLHYIRSKDTDQFKGELSASPDCKPFRTKMVTENGRRINRPIVPCGVIANSLFNDTFTFWMINVQNNGESSIIKVPLTQTGIAWRSDSNRFKNPIGNPIKPIIFVLLLIK